MGILRCKGTGNYLHPHPTPPPPTPLLYVSISTHINLPLSPYTPPLVLPILSKIYSYSSFSPPSCLFYRNLVSRPPYLPTSLSSSTSHLSAAAAVISFGSAVPLPPSPHSPSTTARIFSTVGWAGVKVRPAPLLHHPPPTPPSPEAPPPPPALERL